MNCVQPTHGLGEYIPWYVSRVDRDDLMLWSDRQRMRQPFAIAFAAIPEASGALSRTGGGLPRVIPDETEPSAANGAATRIANWEVKVHFSSPLAVACNMPFLGRSAPTAVSLGHRFRCASGLMEEATQRQPTPQSGGGVVRTAIGIGGVSFGFAIGSAGFHQRPRTLPPSNRQACERHQSTKQAGKDTQRYDAQGPYDHKPSDAAELQLQCSRRRHQW